MNKKDKDLLTLCELLLENWDGSVITVAKTVLEHYQPKLQDHEMIITKEEYERYNQTVNPKKIRKEVATEIYQKLCGHGTTYVKKWIEKEFGVEVKE